MGFICVPSRGSAFYVQVFLERVDGGLRRGARRESAVEAHGLEAFFHLVKGLLADDDVAADVEQDAFEARLVALFAHAAAVQLALAIQGGDDDRVRVGLDCGGDVFFLGNHHAEVDDLEPSVCKRMVKDFVPNSVHIRANYADVKLLFVSNFATLSIPIFCFANSILF